MKWAADAIETSSNQPLLPHAIIAFNASENDPDVNVWNMALNTKKILCDLGSTVHRNETFKRWSKYWGIRGKKIETLEDLLLCYYSSIQVYV